MDERIKIKTNIKFFDHYWHHSAEHDALLRWLHETIGPKDWDTIRTPNTDLVEVVLQKDARASAPLVILAYGEKRQDESL